MSSIEVCKTWNFIMVDLVLRDALKSVYVTWAFNWWSAKSRTITFSFSHGMNLSSKFTHFMNSRLWILVPLSNFLSTHMYTCCLLTLSDHGRRWSFLLRSWRLSAGCVLSPPTTSITLRQKQGGEQETFSRGPLPKKTSLSYCCSRGGCGYFQGST